MDEGDASVFGGGRQCEIKAKGYILDRGSLED